MTYLRNWRLFVYDFFNGIYSGIPLCCVIFFLKKMAQYKNSSVAYNVELERGNVKYQLEDGRFALKDESEADRMYVCCDKCLKNGKKNKLKKNGRILEWIYPEDKT